MPPKKKTNETKQTSKKKKEKKSCYLQYIHKVQGGTSKYHAFKIVVQKNNRHFYFIHASKTVSLNIIVVQHSIPICDTMVCIVSLVEIVYFYLFFLKITKSDDEAGRGLVWVSCAVRALQLHWFQLEMQWP